MKNILVLLLLVIAYLAIFTSGCATIPPTATTETSNPSVEKDFEADGCPTVVLYNSTSTFDSADNANFEIAKNGCKRKYGVDSCLIKFYKTAPQTYRAVCKTFEVK